MKTKFFARLTSMMLAICMMIGVCVPAYAMEPSTAITETEAIAQSDVREIHLGYTEAKSLNSNFLVDERSYECMGRIYLPNDPHIHRILYTAFFKKDASDTGIGDVQLNVQFRKNGNVIYQNSFPYTSTAGMLVQKEVTGVSMNDVVEVWVDASSVNPSGSNNSIRKIRISSFEVYTD